MWHHILQIVHWMHPLVQGFPHIARHGVLPLSFALPPCWLAVSWLGGSGAFCEFGLKNWSPLSSLPLWMSCSILPSSALILVPWTERWRQYFVQVLQYFMRMHTVSFPLLNLLDFLKLHAYMLGLLFAVRQQFLLKSKIKSLNKRTRVICLIVVYVFLSLARL